MIRIITVIWVTSGVHAEGAIPWKRQGKNTNLDELFVATQGHILFLFKKFKNQTKLGRNYPVLQR
jgi:hypothetical protein